MEGKVLNGRYRIDYKVGSGGMAEVFRAFDLEKQRVVAVKALKQEYCSDPQYLRRFTREAQAMLNLSHKNIVNLYDVGNDGDIHYLVLEYVDGCTLRDYMDKHGALKPNVAVKVICEVLDGLIHAHEHGLIHRDVKPQNVMISSKNEIKLADFGIAKFADSATRTYEGTEALGSVFYISPEQAKGDAVDKRTDIYSIGIMLYEMLTGKPPFTGDNAVQIALKHINDDMVSPYNADSGIPIALSDVVMKAASKDADERYQQASELKADLLRALKHPRSRFAKVKSAKEQQGEDAPQGAMGFIKKHIGTIAIVACVVAVIGIFAAMLIISLSGGISSSYKSVPNLLGKTLEAAKVSAEYKGFVIEVTAYEETESAEPGIVLQQNPVPQERAREGAVIKVTVSSMMETVVVPELSGSTLDEARTLLAQYGLALDEEFIDYAASDSPEGTVIAQIPLAGDTVMTGDSVRVTLSKAPDTLTYVVPNLADTSDAYTAVALLVDEGFENYRIHIITDEDIAAAQQSTGGSGASANQGGGADGEDDTEAQSAGSSSGVSSLINTASGSYSNMQVIGQSPAAGTEVLTNTVLIELYVYKPERGEYKHDFSENITLKEGDSFVVTIVTSMGEIVIYETVCEADTETIPFRGYYWQEGTYTCILYVNGVVTKELSREFVQEVPDNG